MKGVKLNLIKEVPDKVTLQELNYLNKIYGIELIEKDKKHYLFLGSVIIDIK